MRRKGQSSGHMSCWAADQYQEDSESTDMKGRVMPSKRASREKPAVDCQTCGACCGPSENSPSFVDLLPADLARLTPSQRKRLVLLFAGPAIRTKHCASGVVCAALVGRIGRRVRCSIYETRPIACRAFKAGSRICRAVMRDVGVFDGGPRGKAR